MPRGRNDYETAQIQGRLWTPEVLRPALWWDASDAATITTVSGQVSQWNDKLGRGRDLSEATLRPSYLIENRNGLNAVTYSSTSQTGLSVSGLSIPFSAQSSFAAARPNGHAAYCAIYSQSDDANDDWLTTAHYVPMHRGDPGLPNQWWSWINNGQRSAYNITNGEWAAFSSVNDGASTVNAYNGRRATTYAYSWPGKTFTRFGVGARVPFSGTTARYAGEIGEVVVIDFASPAATFAIEGYLSWKWGIALAADHPFANRPPLIGD